MTIVLRWSKLYFRRNWCEDYGLSISTINMRNPLSAAEIDAYMDNLPADTSKERREIIQFALSSVGKVPYYGVGEVPPVPDMRETFLALR